MTTQSKRNMAELKGLLFDVDGTLVDNLAYHFAAFDEYAKREGFTLLEPMSLKMNGMHSNQIFPMMVGDKVVAEYGLDRLNREKEEVYREMYHDKVEPIAGLIEFLKAAKAAGVKVKVVGFADKVGSNEYNNKLSTKRAEAVAEIIRSYGVEVEVVAGGESEEYKERMLNRRAVITVAE